MLSFFPIFCYETFGLLSFKYISPIAFFPTYVIICPTSIFPRDCSTPCLLPPPRTLMIRHWTQLDLTDDYK